MYYPSSTYRVQLNSSFTFARLKTLIPYLHQLGISTIYASPITRAIAGSSHGYDVVDPHAINPEIGTLDELREIAAQLKGLGMGWLQDIVPNHMAFSPENARLTDVLERGTCSPYYYYFDINWEHYSEGLKGKVLLPVLGGELADCIQKNDIKLVWSSNGPVLAYFNNSYPLSLSSLEYLFGSVEQIALPADACEKGSLEEWQQAKRNWISALEADTVRRQQVMARIAQVNTNAALLTEVTGRQWYVPACWQAADTGMNYRRFFAVNSLISLRMEEGWVFNDYHLLIDKLYKEGLIQGVRVDHIDGLYNPYDYVQRLRKLLGPDCYIIAEKILEYNEQLPENWPVQGTSGYEFLSFTNQVLTSREGAALIYRFYTTFTGNQQPYKQLVYRNKLSFLDKYLHGEWDMLWHMLTNLQLLPASYNTDKLKKTLGIWMAAFPVYRFYPQAFPLREEDLLRIQQSLEFAVQQEPACWEELAEIRTLFQPGASEEQNEKKQLFIHRLMQFTGPLAAKGVEDTTFYVYNPLISHNEVGDSPEQLGISIDAFHEKMQHRKEYSNYSLNATSTHDTKRGEDARLRINVLSELPEEWIQLVTEWHTVNAALFTSMPDGTAPSANDEYFMYQSLVGSFPTDGVVDDVFRQRSAEFIIKALREAKTHTTYTAQNEAYEQGCVRFMTGLLQHHSFLKSFVPFVQKVAEVAYVYSLTQVVIKCTAPGIPDIYQGCELWDTSYVDPDNRRPVDYDYRNSMLQQIGEQLSGRRSVLPEWLAANRKSGAEKLFITHQVLWYRKQHAALFNEGAYYPLQIAGSHHTVIAYARRWQQQWVMVVLPVAIATAVPGSIAVQLTEGAPADWQDVFTGYRYKNTNGVMELPDWAPHWPVMLEPVAVV